jgi:hypothetical protein
MVPSGLLGQPCGLSVTSSRQFALPVTVPFNLYPQISLAELDGLVIVCSAMPPQTKTPPTDPLVLLFRQLITAINDGADEISAAIDRNTEQLEALTQAVTDLDQPLPPEQGATIMASFIVGASNPDIQIQLAATDFKDDEGNAVDASDIDLSVESSNTDALTATLSSQTLSDDKLTVSGVVDVHFGAPATDIAILTYRATNRDTSLVVAAGSDEFTVQAGEAAIGTVTSNVPLPPA